jgi:hypothetical protein
MKKILSTSIFLFIVIPLFAQRDFNQGYIIKNNGDTAYGQINYMGDEYNSVSCFFKKNDMDDVVKYIPGEIKAYRFIEGKYYVSRNINIEGKEKEVFITRIY